MSAEIAFVRPVAAEPRSTAVTSRVRTRAVGAICQQTDRLPPQSRKSGPSRKSRPESVSSELAEVLRAIAIRFGLHGGIYVHFGHGIHFANAAPISPVRFVASAVADGRFFLAEGGLVVDPVTRRALRAHAPFAWTSSPSKDAEGAEIWLGERLKARNVHGGIAIPVQDYAAGPAFVSLYSAFSGEAEAIIAAHGPDLFYAAAAFHERAKSALAAAVGEGGASLTTREIECLRLAALGRTVSETAVALEVTPRTVEFHLKNAADKLDAPNKLRAVILAVRHGLIAP